MDLELKNEILKIVKALKASKKGKLAECIEENWQKTVFSYSKELNTYKPNRGLENEMAIALEKELSRTGFKGEESAKILDSLSKRRVLQTGPHLGVTENGRMLCINWLGSLGVGDKDYYVVGMFSGIPFSNSFRPGRINKKSESVNLFPSNMQDALVYKSKIPDKLIESISKLPEKIKNFLPEAVEGDSYTRWALNGCQNIEREILKKKNLIYLDINEVVAEYLLQILKNKNHVFYKIFFDPKTREEFTNIFSNEIMFYSPDTKGKYEVIQNFALSKNKLISKNREITLSDPQTLIKEIKERRLCPALLTGFLALVFLNEFKCFGSFRQVEYLPIYQEKLNKLKFMKEFNIEKIPTANLTTGVFNFNTKIFPIDILLGEKFTPNENILFGELLLPMKNILLENKPKK